MSSILTALKKLEKDDELNEIALLSGNSAAQRKARSLTVFFPFRFSVVLPVVFCLLALSIVSGVTLRVWKHPETAAVHPRQDSLITAESAAGKVQENRVSASLPLPPSESPDSLPKASIAQILPRQTDILNQQDLPDAHLLPSTGSENFQTPDHIPSAKINEGLSGSLPRASEKTAVFPPAEKSEWTLQAIAWSADPAQRIAVINGSVMREGGFLNGARISRIDEQEVELKKGSETWKLVFRLH